MDWLQAAGVLGLLMISTGVLLRARQLQDEFYMAGGVLLLIYSVGIDDWIFMILQVIFIGVALYDFVTKRRLSAPQRKRSGKRTQGHN